MNWHNLISIDQLEVLSKESNQHPVIIFKHSTSCSISKATLNRLERNWNLNGEVKTYFLDLLAHRSMSNAIAEKFSVAHESPQVLIIENEKAVYNRSHFDINYQDIKDNLHLVAD